MQAALDKMTEDNQTGCTLVIAHRLATVRSCHRIVVMDHGRVMEEGPHDALLKIPIEKSPAGEMVSGWYHDLWNTQMGKGSDSEELEALRRRVKELDEKVWLLSADNRRRFESRLSRRVEPPTLQRLSSLDDGSAPPPLPTLLDRALSVESCQECDAAPPPPPLGSRALSAPVR